MQVIRKIRMVLPAVALVFACSAGAHEFPAQQHSNVVAHGTDPAWRLDIDGAGGSLALTVEGVTSQFRIPALAPTIYRDQQKMVYRVPDRQHVLTVFVKGQACRDVPTGKSHEVTVLVSYDGKAYSGCGDILNR